MPNLKAQSTHKMLTNANITCKQCLYAALFTQCHNYLIEKYMQAKLMLLHKFAVIWT